MNQILSVELPKRKEKYYKRNSNKADIKTIIIFFSIILILFAAIIIVVGISIKNKKNTEGEQPNQGQVVLDIQPKINFEIGDTTVNIIITHDKQISYIAYYWNNEEKVEKYDLGETSTEIQVQIPSGKNTLNVEVKDVYAITAYNSTDVTSKGPVITRERDGNKVNLIVESDTNIAHVSYNWDGGDEKLIQVNDVRIEIPLDILEGLHTLNVVAVDTERREIAETFEFKGDNEPWLDISRNDTELFIKASDDEELTKLTIKDFNTGETKEYEIHYKEFEKVILIHEGELSLKEGENKLIFTLYNINGVKNEQRVRLVK